MEIELSFSYPSSQISWFPFPGPSGFGTPNLWKCGFSEVVYRWNWRRGEQGWGPNWLADWLLRQVLPGCLYLSECPVVPETGPRFQMCRNSVCIGSPRGTLALGDGFIKTKVTGDLLSFKETKESASGPWLFSSSRTHMVTYHLGHCSSVKEILNKHPNMCIVISKSDTYCCAKMLWVF